MHLIPNLALLSIFATIGMGLRIAYEVQEEVPAEPVRKVITLFDYTVPVVFANYDPIMAKACCRADRDV